MADFAVSFNPGSTGGRLTTGGDSTTGWSGGGAEPDFFYQGAASYSVLVKTSEAGVSYTHTSTLDFSTTPKIALLKVIQTNKDALDGDGVQLWIGNDASNAYSYFVFTATSYPAEGGWQVVAIDPAVSQWRSATEGSAPSLSAIDYFAFRSDCSATAKSQNFAGDAIDVIEYGYGLLGVGSDTTGDFDDFIDFDYGTVGNRYGIVQSRGGILYVTGTLQLGSSATPAVFADANRVLVFPDHRVTTGFCGVQFDLQNATTAISLTNCLLTGRGALYTSDDTRPDYGVTGTSGTLDAIGCTFNGFRQIDLTSACDFTGSNFIEGLQVNANTSTLVNTAFSGCTGAADESYLVWDTSTDPDGYLDGATFEKGTTATHAIEFGTGAPTSITLRDMTFSGYNASDGQTDSTFYVAATGGTVTINLVGCSGNSTYKSAGATVSIVVDPVTTTITVRDIDDNSLVENARVLLIAADATGDLPYQESVSITRSDTTATVSHTGHGLSTGDIAYIVGADQQEYNGAREITVTGANSYTYTVSGTPTTPATGAITSTGGLFNDLTNASGVVTDTRSWSNNQPFTGRIRKSSGSPYYGTTPLSGTISTTTGFSGTFFLIPDE